MQLPISTIDPGWQSDEMAMEMAMQKCSDDVGAALMRFYPNYHWYVRCEANKVGGVALISIPIITGNWRKPVLISDINSDPSMDCVRRAGGEILERFGLRRARRNDAEWRNVADKVPLRQHFKKVLDKNGKVIGRKAPDELQ